MPPPAGQRALFIYYRVPDAHNAEAFQLISALQQGLMQRLPGLRARLWCRADEHTPQASEQTWMEVYEHPEGVSPLCEQWLAERVSGLPAGLIGPRHVEVFAPLDVCAPSRAHAIAAALPTSED